MDSGEGKRAEGHFWRQMMRRTMMLVALCLMALLLGACGRLDVAIVEPTPETDQDVVVPVSDAATRPLAGFSSPTPAATEDRSEVATPEPNTRPVTVEAEETPIVDQPPPAEETGEADRQPEREPEQGESCFVRLDWPLYAVKSGDTLFRIARSVGATVDDLMKANCLQDPDRLFSGQELRVPQLPPNTPVPTPTVQPEAWLRFQDELYQVSFDYPAAWRDTSSELITRLTGDDGWLQVAGAGTPADLDSFTVEQAYHKLQPYGSDPRIEQLVLSDGRQARLILPSADQPMIEQAMFITPYADPVFIGDQPINYLMLAADKGHIRDIVATLTMPPPANDIFIDHFSVSGEDLPAGGKRLTFHWQARGASRGTITSGTSQRFPPRWPVQSVGQLVVDVDGTNFPDPAMTLRLVNDVTGQEASATAILSWACAQSYFFQPGPEICPQDAALVVDGAYQPFERGFMIWLPRPDLPQASIYVFTDDGRVSLFPDFWAPGEPSAAAGESPPDGLFEPVGGFAKVWYEHPAVREDLGWGTAEEQLYTLTYQAEAPESPSIVSYLTRPDGTIVRLQDTNWQEFTPGRDLLGTGHGVTP